MMSTIFNIRSLKAPKVGRRTLIAAAVAAVLAITAAIGGYQLYSKLTTISAVAYFRDTLALYAGDEVQIQGVRVGAIDSIEPAGDKMKVSFHYDRKYKVPADVTASVLNPSLVASRAIDLSPRYTGGPQLGNNAIIPLQRTQVPVEWDELRAQITNVVTELAPGRGAPKGPFGEAIESFADGLAGKGRQINTTLNNLSEALTAVNEGRGDFFAVLKSLAVFVNALHDSDQQFVALNSDLATFTGSLINDDRELANAIDQVDQLLATTRKFVEDNGPALTKDIQNLADVTTTILQPTPRDGLETALHVLPTMGTNFTNIYDPAHGALTAIPVVGNFSNPMQLICSAIQAGSRLGYQESAELCAQYLAPILDAIKFNFPPFGTVPLTTPDLLPKHVAYSEERLRPPPGYKDTTVPGIWSRDTLFSHGNHEPGWIVAPGMQGIQVQPFTANMLTPDSLAALLGGPDPGPPPPAGPRGGAPPNAYDQNNPLPPPWYPQPLPTPTAPVPAGPPPLPAEAAPMSGAGR